MKVLFITPARISEENPPYCMAKEWERYCSENPNVSVNVEFEYRYGSDKHEIWLDMRRFFNENDITKLEEEIESLIQSNELFGLIIDPILTYAEEGPYISGKTLERLYNMVNQRVPVLAYDLGFCMSSFYEQPIYKKMDEDCMADDCYVGKYANYWGKEPIACDDIRIRAAFDYFLNSYYKRAKNVKLVRKKEEN